MLSATLRDSRSRKVLFEYQLLCRNSKAYSYFFGSMHRKLASRSSFASKRAGNWNRTGPHFGPRSFSRLTISSMEFAELSPSLFQCVTNCEAFHAKRKPGGV